MDVHVFARNRQILAGLMAVWIMATGCSEDAEKTKPTPPPAASKAGASAVKVTSEPGAAKKVEAAVAAPDSRTTEELVAAGRSTYNANCIACHAIDPTADGALGPAVAGASLELLEARVMRGEYPEGYTPKRPSRVMVPLPHLEPRLPELAAYLGSLE